MHRKQSKSQENHKTSHRVRFLQKSTTTEGSQANDAFRGFHFRMICCKGRTRSGGGPPVYQAPENGLEEALMRAALHLLTYGPGYGLV